jgi:hypothetical protein
MSTESDTYKLFLYIQQRIQGNHIDNEGATYLYYLIKKFGTFQLINNDLMTDGSLCKTTYNARVWHEFRMTSFDEVMKDLLSQRKIHSTIVIFRRHFQGQTINPVEDIHSNLILYCADESNWRMSEILEYLPDDLPCSNYADWLRNEVFPNVSDEIERLLKA